ncbi:dTMP kinase [Varibaculum prostatecancerukia]|uniref:dTMP kinase n=1 Tax=Varibaculum prostatecancerukia TaxID=2811781 RepID=UPI001C0080BF|nr:dTMP kinase [Varibaculum prostatecancerukia]
MNAAAPYPGFFISFEGGDYTGKSTQVKLLMQALAARGAAAVATFEPGGTGLGQRLRREVMHGEDLDPYTEALLYAADRAWHAQKVIKPHLLAGEVVVSDRYLDSSLAYQGIGRGLGLEKIEEISLWATGNLLPDLTILLDGDPEVLVARRTDSPDRMEAAGLAFHQSVRKAFLQIAERDKQRIKVLDATADVEEIHQQVLSLVSAAFAARAKVQAGQYRDGSGSQLADLGTTGTDTSDGDSRQAGLQQL